MIGVIVLVRGKETVSLHVYEDCVLNHTARLATFLMRDTEIAVFDDSGGVWRGVAPSKQLSLLDGAP